MIQSKLIIEIPAGSLLHHPKNPRSDLGDLTELTESIRASGIMQNLTVVKSPEDAGKYWVVIGNRRLEAGLMAGLEVFPCAVVEMDEKAQMTTMMAENMQRQDLTVYDQIQGIGYMQQLGMTLPEIAEGTGLSEGTIRKRATIGKLPKKQLALACDKGASLLDLLEVTKLESQKAQEEVLETFGTNNFQYSINQAIRQEKIKKWRSVIMPEIEANYPKLKTISDSDRWNGHWTEICRWAYDNDDAKPIPAPEDGEKYGIEDYQYQIILHKENKDWVQRKASEKDYNAWLKERKATAKALNKEAYELRCSFVRKFALRTQKEIMAFHDLLLGEVELWKSFTKGVGYYHSSWDCSGIRQMLAIPYETDGRDSEETFAHELERRGIRKETFTLAWALCGGIAGYVRPDDGYVNDYNAQWKTCEELDGHYRILKALGYEMSDFEKSLQDGSHVFFKEERK